MCRPPDLSDGKNCQTSGSSGHVGATETSPVAGEECDVLKEIEAAIKVANYAPQPTCNFVVVSRYAAETALREYRRMQNIHERGGGRMRDIAEKIVSLDRAIDNLISAFEPIGQMAPKLLQDKNP